MGINITNSSNHRSSSFQRIASAFLAQPALPFAKLLSAERIQRVFAKHGGLFGLHGVYSTAMMLWSFLGQVLRDGKEAACQAAVARVVAYCRLRGTEAPSCDTGDYCRARAKLPQAEIAQLYGHRWNAELDIRSIKQTLNLGHVRCKSPTMVRKEFWTTLLAYNLIRTVAAGAALVHHKQPRQISFTCTCQYVVSLWMVLSCEAMPPGSLSETIRALLKQIASREVANRPGRLKPRVIKRRRHGYKLMQKSRSILREELRKQRI